VSEVSKASANPPSQQRSAPILPSIGLFKWRDIAPFVGMSRESWRKLVNAGRAPSPIRLTSSCSLYRAQDVHAWMADPLGYAAEPVEQHAE
jgi:predicted DNA-binding transcriptional regulator AlpA